MIDAQLRQEIITRYQSEPVYVAYEDMANLRRIGAISGYMEGEFHIVWSDSEDDETWSDLRQYGWKLV